MDSSVSPKDEIWFLRVCHHVSNAVYLSYSLLHKRVLATSGFYLCFYLHSACAPLCCTKSLVYLCAQELKCCNITVFIRRNVAAAICLCGGFSDQFSALAIHHASAAKYFPFFYTHLSRIVSPILPVPFHVIRCNGKGGKYLLPCRSSVMSISKPPGSPYLF